MIVNDQRLRTRARNNLLHPTGQFWAVWFLILYVVGIACACVWLS